MRQTRETKMKIYDRVDFIIFTFWVVMMLLSSFLGSYMALVLHAGT